MDGNETSPTEVIRPTWKVSSTEWRNEPAPKSWTQDDAQRAASVASYLLTQAGYCNPLGSYSSCVNFSEANGDIGDFEGLLGLAQRSQPEVAAEFTSSLRESDLFQAALPSATLHYLARHMGDMHDPRNGSDISKQDLTVYRDDLPTDTVERDIVQYAIDHFDQIRDFNKSDNNLLPNFLIPQELQISNGNGLTHFDLAMGIEKINELKKLHTEIPLATFLVENSADITEHDTITRYDLTHYAKEQQAAGDTDKFESTRQAMGLRREFEGLTENDIVHLPLFPWQNIYFTRAADGISPGDLGVILNSQDELDSFGLTDALLTRVQHLLSAQ